MKSILKLLPILFLVLASCSKKKGCSDPYALNQDASAEKDGNCQFTQVIFYAASNRIGGTADRLVKREIYRIMIQEYTLIGTIDNLEEMDYEAPIGCSASEKSFVYQFDIGSSVPSKFTTRYFYEDGAEENGDSFDFGPDPEKECIV